MDGCIDDLRFYAPFNSISTISGQWLGDYGKMCAMEPRLRSERFSPPARLKLGTSRSVGQRLTHSATRAPPLKTVRVVDCTNSIPSYRFMHQHLVMLTVRSTTSTSNSKKP